MIVLVYGHGDFWWFICLNVEVITEFHNLRLIENIATFLHVLAPITFVEDFIAKLTLHGYTT